MFILKLGDSIGLLECTEEAADSQVEAGARQRGPHIKNPETNSGPHMKNPNSAAKWGSSASALYNSKRRGHVGTEAQPDPGKVPTLRCGQHPNRPGEPSGTGRTPGGMEAYNDPRAPSALGTQENQM